MSTSSVPSFAHLLWERAQNAPDQTAYTYLSEPGGSLTYRELHDRAASLGARLRELATPGDRAVLLVPPGLDYIAAFFGCLYAGVVAVPAYPPLDARQIPRLLSVIANARPRMVLSLGMFAEMIRDSLSAYGAGALPVIAVDQPGGPEPLPAPLDRGRDDIAFLQYTSGSASDPKGVVITHGNLFSNSEAIRVLFGHDRDSVGVIWLPPYHDMGLIGGILQPLYADFPVVLMSPLVLGEPAAWLRAISDHRATTSGGPNFAFDLCVHKTTEEQRAGLDLSSWSLAFCGAEPVRGESLARFAAEFAPYGFSPGALYPCYGLAESTLIATGGVKGTGVISHQGAVSCGRPIPGHELSLRLPDGSVASDGETGEIWLSGPSVAGGYWDSPEADAATFTRDADGAIVLRTGDLGVLRDGMLFVTGRSTDQIIVHGRNLAAADVEFAVEGAHPSIRPGCVAAFGVPGASGEELAVVVELRAAPNGTADEVRSAVQTSLAAALGATAGWIALAHRGSVPKTPSGKIRRPECRALYLDGRLNLFDGERPAQPVTSGGVRAAE